MQNPDKGSTLRHILYGSVVFDYGYSFCNYDDTSAGWWLQHVKI